MPALEKKMSIVAVALLGGRDQRVDLVAVADVDLHDVAARVQVGSGDPRALLLEAGRAREADPARGPGDDDVPVGQLHARGPYSQGRCPL